MSHVCPRYRSTDVLSPDVEERPTPGRSSNTTKQCPPGESPGEVGLSEDVGVVHPRRSYNRTEKSVVPRRPLARRHSVSKYPIMHSPPVGGETT